MDQDPHSCCTLDPDPAGVSDLKKKKKDITGITKNEGIENSFTNLRCSK